VQNAAPARDAVGIVLSADARLLPHCCYAVRRSPRTRYLRGTTPLSHHSKKRNRCGRYSEQPCSATIDDANTSSALHKRGSSPTARPRPHQIGE
jgi:hypothetical protein